MRSRRFLRSALAMAALATFTIWIAWRPNVIELGPLERR
jgi:hypothetical protein